jgi:hypothetical protein
MKKAVVYSGNIDGGDMKAGTHVQWYHPYNLFHDTKKDVA